MCLVHVGIHVYPWLFFLFRFILIVEITAANKSNVCTYAVLGPQQVAQPVRIVG